MKPLPLLLSLLLALSSAPALARTAGEVEIGHALPEARMQGLSGPSRKLSEFRGKPLVVNVWASWCGPCRAEMASLDRLARRYSGRQFTVIGVSTDDYRERAAAFLQQANTAFSHFIDLRPFPLENMLGADRLPLTVLIDAEGRVVARFYGAREWDSPAAVETIAKAFKLKL